MKFPKEYKEENLSSQRNIDQISTSIFSVFAID
jgi:hypothetical protein